MGSHRILLTAGSNAKGQLGIGSYDDAHTFAPCQFAECKPNQLPEFTSSIAHIACGANHTVLLLEHLDGSTTLWGTGDGRGGQLGPEYRREEPDPAPWTIFHKLVLPQSASNSYASCGYTYKCIATAWETTYVVLSCPGRSDVLLSMGSNDFGVLGVGEGMGGDGLVPGEPRLVDLDHIFPDDSGRHAQPRTICVQSLHAGPRHVVARLVVASSDGSSSYSQTVLVGWGASRHGQLGQNGGVRFVARPTPLPINIHEDPMVACALGNQHTVVLHESGRISALGSNKQGQIPSFKSQKRICRLGCTWNGTYMQAVDGDKHGCMLSTGNNAQGQLGRGYAVESTSTVNATVSLPVDRAISSFACGSEHVLVAMSSSAQEGDSVLGWGWNEHGNMGLGYLGNISIPTQLWPREAYNKYPQGVIGIWAGCATSWLLVE
ncbi:regulator of chromosome condensation 1/beta-lactamase-inhibitor protein II [Butyriboletus roseoflavus]|nr:regulator of chromosome condensation 1/beta-lactamase-inhibitor protein II [Butyriboletus roseoflavus]